MLSKYILMFALTKLVSLMDQTLDQTFNALQKSGEKFEISILQYFVILIRF